MINEENSGRRAHGRGSTFIQIALVVVIVGVAGVALLEFVVSATRANAAVSEHTVALNIARAGQQWAVSCSRLELEAWFAAHPNGKPSELLGGSGLALVDSDTARVATYRGWSQEPSLQRISVFVGPAGY